MVPPLKPQEITYGTAIVDGINVATKAQGFVSEIKDTKQGGFSDAAVATLSRVREAPGSPSLPTAWVTWRFSRAWKTGSSTEMARRSSLI